MNKIYQGKQKIEYEFKPVSSSKKYVILVSYCLAMIVFGLITTPFREIFAGMSQIVSGTDLLVTDYLVVGGLGAAFVNAGLVGLISIYLLFRNKIAPSGITFAAIWLITGFSLFGKNIFNIWFIFSGVAIFAKYQKESFTKYIYIALFGAALSPIVTQVMFKLDKPLFIRIPVGILVGLSVGFILPPLSSYLVRVHQGFSLYNIGFTAGIIGTVYVAIFRSFGFVIPNTFIWSTEYHQVLGWYLITLFVSMVVLGFMLNPKAFKGLKNIYKMPGRLVSDFIILEGMGSTLVNMGINGIFATLYILVIKGTLNGPTVGGIFAIVGFSAFGKHFRNILPVIAGVVLGSLAQIWSINDPSIQLAALFSTTLAPIAGEFGWGFGILAGFLHSSVVLNVGYLHAGLNLYNNGFAGGIVAATLIPIIEALGKED